jgi:NAD+ diphosphatase
MNDSVPAAFFPAVEPTSAAQETWSGEPRGRCFAFRGADMLVLQIDEAPEVPSWEDLRRLSLAPVRYQFLGTLAGEPCWSLELPSEATQLDGVQFTNLRALYDALSESHYAVAGRAAQIVAWERDHQHCGRCGAPTVRVPGERGRRCAACDLTAYPRLSPAIIVLIERGNQILLARGHAFVPRRFGIVAGFVEPGESLEDAVRREVREEVGVTITEPAYFGSQPWPFPHGIMIGFRADHHRGEIALNDGELAEAGWYAVDDLPEIPTKLSIARRLIDDWAMRQGVVIDRP